MTKKNDGIAGILNAHLYGEILEIMPGKDEFDEFVNGIISEFETLALKWSYEDLALECELMRDRPVDAMDDYARGLAGELAHDFSESLKISMPDDLGAFKTAFMTYFLRNIYNPNFGVDSTGK